MGKKPEDDIQMKLVELELKIKEEEKKAIVASRSGTGSNLSTTKKNSVQGVQGGTQESTMVTIKEAADAELKADLSALGGMGLTALSLVLVFSHVQVGAFNWGAWGGMGLNPMMSIGTFLIPLFVGLGMLFYNYKSRIGQLLTVLSLGAVLLSVIMRLQMTFAPMSLLQLVLMIVPLCAGVALMLKAHYRHSAVKEIAKGQLE